jgi:hypothetical protein
MDSMNCWMTPVIFRSRRANWELAEAISVQHGYQTLYCRHAGEADSFHTYELYCVLVGRQIPAEDRKADLVDMLQTLARTLSDSSPNYDDSLSMALPGDPRPR